MGTWAVALSSGLLGVLKALGGTALIRSLGIQLSWTDVQPCGCETLSA